MKQRPTGKQLLQNKWVVPLCAVILTMAIGSFALAGVNGTDGYPMMSTSTTLTAPAAYTATTVPALPFQVTDNGAAGATTPTTLDAAALAAEQAKENAILDLIGEKMSPEDKSVFEQLRTIAASQHQALTQAQADLQATKAQLTALIDKYLGVSSAAGLNLAPGQTASTTPTTVAPGYAPGE
jgi:hypothetical protein